MLCSRQPGCSLDRSFGSTKFQILQIYTPGLGALPLMASQILWLFFPCWASQGGAPQVNLSLDLSGCRFPVPHQHHIPAFHFFLPLKQVKEEQRMFPASQTVAFSYTLTSGTFLMLPEAAAGWKQAWEMLGIRGSSGNFLCNLGCAPKFKESLEEQEPASSLFSVPTLLNAGAPARSKIKEKREIK